MVQYPSLFAGIMLFKSLLIVLLSSFVCGKEVHKKLCANVDSSQCVVHTVNVEPCLHGPRFCSMILGKKYNVNFNFTTYFSAHDVKVSILSDPEDGISMMERTYKDACSKLLTCPLEESVRQSLDIPLSFDGTLGKMYHGKFPVQVKLWNAADETQMCCFTFKAKVK